MQNVHFTPPELAKLFSVNVSTVKRWVDRGLLGSEKTAGGHRRISKEQLASFIKRYPTLSKKSYTIKRLVKQSSARTSTTSWQQYYHCLLADQLNDAERIIKEAYVVKPSIVGLLEEIIAPALRHIGVEWLEGNISVYQEHRMTFVIRQHLLTIDSIAFSGSHLTISAPLAILACARGDHHEMALQMLALVLKQQGWRTHILGINVPAEEILKAIDETNPQLVGISKSYSSRVSNEYLLQVAKYCCKESVPLVYGGSGWHKKTHEEISKHKDLTATFISSLSELDALLTAKFSAGAK